MPLAKTFWNFWLTTGCPAKTDQTAQLLGLILRLRCVHMQFRSKFSAPTHMFIELKQNVLFKSLYTRIIALMGNFST